MPVNATIRGNEPVSVPVVSSIITLVRLSSLYWSLPSASPVANILWPSNTIVSPAFGSSLVELSQSLFERIIHPNFLPSYSSTVVSVVVSLPSSPVLVSVTVFVMASFSADTSVTSRQ